jgi:hypothetical protein
VSIDAATLRIRYPRITATDETINYWLTDAASIVTADWGVDQEPATLALAAHNISRNAAASEGGTSIPAGVTRFRSGSFDVSFSDSAAAQSASGGYASTPYGSEFLTYLARNSGGPFLVGYVDVC